MATCWWLSSQPGCVAGGMQRTVQRLGAPSHFCLDATSLDGYCGQLQRGDAPTRRAFVTADGDHFPRLTHA
jgi:hypothetical protein